MPTQTDDTRKRSEAAQSSCVNDSAAADWYEALREQIDHHCSFCDGLHFEVADLEKKAKTAYAKTAEKTKEIFDQKEIASLWFAMYALASEIYAMAFASSQAHQICGADLSGIKTCVDASLGNFEIHCPISLCGS
jgi:hypothetical protein